MLRSFVVDSDRDLNENGDLLGTMCYANQLVDTIKSIPSKQAYTVGLYGSWGSGKSTIIRTAQKKLNEDQDKRIRVIIYDAWKYSGDSFRRMFLLHLQNELELKPSPEMERFYKAVTEEIKPNLILRKRGILYLVCATAIVLLAIVLVILLGSQDARTWVTLLLSVITLFSVSLGGNLFYELKVSQTKNVLFAPEQFEECFCQMMEKVLREKAWYKKKYSSAKSFFCKEKPKVSNLDKLVIVIDNLDRCDTEVVYSMLTDIKTFLGTEKYDVVFVVPVDDTALKKHLFAKHKEESEPNAEEFLRKFFNVVIRIKPHRSDDLLHYINELNKDQKLEFDPNTLALVANEYAENPRRILQMLNNLTVEQSLYEEDFAKQNETLIAVCMILREKYPDVVKDILKNPAALSKRSFYESNSFLPKAMITLSKAESKNLWRILTNTDNAINLSLEIKNALDSYDSQSILSYIRNSQTLRTDIFIEINRRLKNAQSYSAIDSMEQLTECIADVNLKEKLSHNEIQSMNEALSSIYDRIPQDIIKSDAICKFAKDLCSGGMVKLRKSLFDFVKNPEMKQRYPQHYDEYVRDVIKTFTSRKDCEELREFTENYMSNIDDISTFTFTETQREHLLTSAFVMGIINSVTTIKDTRQQKTLAWCFENLINISPNTYGVLIDKLVALVNPRDRKTADELCEYVEFALPVLKAMSQDIDVTVLNNFYNGSIMNKRLNPQGTQKVSIIHEVDERKARILAEFCFEIYRLSGRQFSINPNLVTIQPKCEEYVKDKLIQMNHEGVSLVPFRSNILAFETKDDKWYELIPYAFEKYDGIKEEEKEKIRQTLQFLYENRENSKALDLLVSLTSDENVCNLFITQLKLEDYETLNNLPESLLPRIISRYTLENASQFKMNNAMLKIVLKKGNPTQKEQVTKTLIDRINNDEDMIGTLDIVDSYEKWKKTDKNVLKSLLSSKMPEETETTSWEDVSLTEEQQRIKDILPKLQ